jgi:hypothetical protein
MKKKITLFVLVLVLATALILPRFLYTTVRHTVRIPYSHTRVMDQLSDSRQISLWMQPFAGNPATQLGERGIRLQDDELQLSEMSGIASKLQLRLNGVRKDVYFKALPDSTRPFETDVTVLYKTSLWNRWTGGGAIDKQIAGSIDSLKNWMTDTRRFYGFQITSQPVTDSFFLFTSRTLNTSELKPGSEKLYRDLIAYAQAKGLGYSGVRIFNATKLNDQQTELYASIGVNKRILSKPGDPFQFKAMPGRKNLLVAYYDGPFKDARLAYEALERYRSDRAMQTMAMPFAKIMQEGMGFMPDEKVKLNVTLPVY